MSVSFSILINGKPRERFGGSRGIHQGDPLSPFLFILVADALSRRISRGVSRGLFKPIVVGSPGIAISHLQFADDTLIFGEDDSTS